MIYKDIGMASVLYPSSCNISNVSEGVILRSLSTRRSWKTLGKLFYLVDPKTTYFERVEDVPDYLAEVGFFILAFAILENCVAFYKGKRISRLNDSITCFCQGLFYEIVSITTASFHFAAYLYIYNNWRFVTLPWNTLWSWMTCFIVFDFAYYWMHRAHHEINILWATHQVHHSSEELNLATAFRLPVMQFYTSLVFYIPLGFLLPPGMILVHYQLNLIFQYWIHTQMVTNLGPFEYFLNTPSHHRVHHGRNRRYIDKNYGGVFIFWDKLFGTFEPEETEVIYGITTPLNTFRLFPIQFSHFTTIWKNLWSVKGLLNKLSVLFKGPGWSPGKPRLGNPEDIPDISGPIDKYDVQIPVWCKLYAVIHMVLIVEGNLEIVERYQPFPATFPAWTILIYQGLSLISLCELFDRRWPQVAWLEFTRCHLLLAIDFYVFPGIPLGLHETYIPLFGRQFLKAFVIFSAILWGFILIDKKTGQPYSSKID